MQKLSIAAIALAVFSLSAPTGAQTPTTTSFMTVDAVNVGDGKIEVTGVVQGDSTPTTRAFHFYVGTLTQGQMMALEACHRSLLLALSKPGQYVADVGLGRCTVALLAR